MKEKKYDITVSADNIGYGAPVVLLCTQMSKNEIQNYLGKVTKQRTIPKTSCAYNIKHHLQNCGCIDVLLDQNKQNVECIQKEYSSYMKISVQMTNWRKCPREACLENIKSGKCTDLFIVNLIGKQFFSDKYQK